MTQLLSVTLLLLITLATGEINVPTKGEFENVYFALNGSTVVRFKVKAASDVTVTFVTKPSLDISTDPYLEVVLGGSKNQVSFIRKQRYGHGITDVPTPEILSDSEYRGFWIKLIPPASVMVGKQNEKVPLLVWTDPNPFQITHFGVGTCCGATGDWKIEEEESKKDVSICAPGDVTSADNPVAGDEPVYLVKDTCYQLLTDVYSCSSDNRNRINKKKTYQILKEKKNWDEAKATCEAQGHRLASVRSKEEQAKLQEVIQSYQSPISGVWIAANDRAQHDRFVWHDGSNDPLTFTNWVTNSPPAHDVTGKNCVFASYVSLVTQRNALWFVHRCNENINFVCELYE